MKDYEPVIDIDKEEFEREEHAIAVEYGIATEPSILSRLADHSLTRADLRDAAKDNLDYLLDNTTKDLVSSIMSVSEKEEHLPVEDMILFELEAIRNGVSTSAMTTDLLGKLDEKDVVIAHKMLLDEDLTEEEVAKEVGMTRGKLRDHVVKNKNLQQYMQNIQTSEETYESIKAIRHNKRIKNHKMDIDHMTLKSASDYIDSLDQMGDNEGKIKFLMKYQKTASSMKDTDYLNNNKENNRIIINNTVSSQAAPEVTEATITTSAEDETLSRMNNLMKMNGAEDAVII